MEKQDSKEFNSLVVNKVIEILNRYGYMINYSISSKENIVDTKGYSDYTCIEDNSNIVHIGSSLRKINSIDYYKVYIYYNLIKLDFFIGKVDDEQCFFLKKGEEEHLESTLLMKFIKLLN